MAGDDDRLRIMHGGPFYELMTRLGMRNRGWRAFVFAGLCWTIPVVLLLATRGGHGAGLFLHDWGAWAKFLIAPVLLTLAEKPISFALDECVSILFRIPLVASQSMPDARKALREAKSRTTSWKSELVCIAVALAATALNVASFIGGAAPAWAVSDGNITLTGLWCLAVGNTVYWFLLTRLVWKHAVWWQFLSAVGRCHLRLAVTHPDGHGGLGFLGFYPTGYGLFTMAVSAVFAAGVSHVMQRQAVTPGLFTAVCVAWLIVVCIYYFVPMARAALQVSRLKRKAVLHSLPKVTNFERLTERTTLGENVFADEAESAARELHDVKPIYLASMKTSALLINKGNILSVLAPALLPMLIVGASYLPFSQLGPIVKRLLLL
ncbi:hypothetical protein GFM09_21520 [Rhizobium leguminosarum bv. viciae]|uniref:hypothetical protein n=1 Tax=Rhizobium leguminosarum TaxID=384 RepID=UPI00144244E0|nr:hypothetical protein [Rhizobium leguminosarum]NKL63927.1 hypothetical protein [Rhizobium leguminosarum bv. viciae]NKL71823.1 hypothetical protein [Rhizobium leguminosarum bv. viciae]NKL83797.1 hypothetical protein [Rhizobium leguminosarum bv. viciae]